MAKKKQSPVANGETRPPIVAVLGHVDHGKTTLLDYIRKSSVAGNEAGHITQKIGAYQIKLKTQNSKLKNEDKKITFIDTPGHEAFAKIRSRGASVADIAVLVVAANDGVKPQTEESISYIKKSQIPIIVAINKIDLPDVNTQKVKQQLVKHDVLVEGLGGKVVVVELSAKTGKGVDELLDMILLVAEMKELKADSQGALSAVVIDAKKDSKRGVLATIIVKNGTLAVGDVIYTDNHEAKVRALFDENTKQVHKALPSQAVEMLGFKNLPSVGSVVSTTPSSTVKEVKTTAKKSIEEILLSQVKEIQLKVIIRADSSGSLEAILESLPKGVDVVLSGIGDVIESDVFLATESKAIILGFNTKASTSVKKIAERENVRIKTYKIIYKLLDEINEVIEILADPSEQEEILGTAVVLAEFPFEKTRIAGCKIEEGRVVRGDMIRIVREGKEIEKAKIKSLQKGKEKVDKVVKGHECGILFDKELDFQIKDSIIAYKTKQLLA